MTSHDRIERNSQDGGFSVTYLSSGVSRSHDDIMLCFDAQCYILDSYYFLLAFRATTDELAGPEESILYFLARCREQVSKMKSGHTLFLPFDLSDEHVGGIALERIDDKYQTTYGLFCQVEGWSVNPEEFKSRADFSTTEFTEASSCELTIDQLVKGLTLRTRRI